MECGVDTEKYAWLSQQTYSEWRSGCEAAVLIQVGAELTAAARRGKQVGLGSDGGAVDRHVKGFVLTPESCRLSCAPWEQGTKAGAYTAEQL